MVKFGLENPTGLPVTAFVIRREPFAEQLPGSLIVAVWVQEDVVASVSVSV